MSESEEVKRRRRRSSQEIRGLPTGPRTLFGASATLLLGSWFIVGDVLAFLGERKDRVLRQVTIVPVITRLLYGMSAAIAPLMAVALCLSAFDCIVRRG
jgi:hypothetical protein